METNSMTKKDFKEDLLPKTNSAFSTRTLPKRSQEQKIEQQEQLRQDLHIKYQKYFQQWRDYDMLLTILAMIGVILAVIEQESAGQHYEKRNAQEMREKSFIRIIITITTMLAIVALLFRNWLYVFWRDFNSSKELQSKFLELELQPYEQDGVNNVEVRRRNRVLSIIRRRKKYLNQTKETHFVKWIKKLFSKECIFEILILIIHPFPYLEEEYTFKILNMLGTKDKMVDVKYMLSDFLFAYMFLRFYFFIRTVTNFSIYSELNSRRICSNNGFAVGTGFVLKANVQKRPGSTVLFISCISVMWLSYLLRIFEKNLNSFKHPSRYKRFYLNIFQFQDILSESRLNCFRFYITAMWCVVITMTTVGYGDVFAVSPFGRVISIINALWGAFVISMLVASIGTVFDLNEQQKKAIVEITNRKQAALSLKASLKYFIAKKEYQKKIESDEKIANNQFYQSIQGESNYQEDYVPSKQEIQVLKDRMTQAAEDMKNERATNQELLPQDVEGENIELMLEGQAIKAKSGSNEQILHETEQDDYGNDIQVIKGIVKEEFTEFTLNSGAETQDTLDGLTEDEVMNFVNQFEKEAKKTVGAGVRDQFRRAEAMKPLKERVNEAIAYYENMAKAKKQQANANSIQ
eukprot:403371299